jgi:hypothetical protein
LSERKSRLESHSGLLFLSPPRNPAIQAVLAVVVDHRELVLATRAGFALVYVPPAIPMGINLQQSMSQLLFLPSLCRALRIFSRVFFDGCLPSLGIVFVLSLLWFRRPASRLYLEAS